MPLIRGSRDEGYWLSAAQCLHVEGEGPITCVMRPLLMRLSNL